LAPEDAQALGLADSKEAMVLALVVIPEDPRNMTANLAGPLVINTRTRSGRQVILDTQRFPLKHRILGEA
ncbi:MAG TPA: flagellar assembly protein FliW, partial [Holophaga sp.]|nr:flagellar assembly protein FliW [Holophaga sp.]